MSEDRPEDRFFYERAPDQTPPLMRLELERCALCEWMSRLESEVVIARTQMGFYKLYELKKIRFDETEFEVHPSLAALSKLNHAREAAMGLTRVAERRGRLSLQAMLNNLEDFLGRVEQIAPADLSHYDSLARLCVADHTEVRRTVQRDRDYLASEYNVQFKKIIRLRDQLIAHLDKGSLTDPYGFGVHTRFSYNDFNSLAEYLQRSLWFYHRHLDGTAVKRFDRIQTNLDNIAFDCQVAFATWVEKWSLPGEKRTGSAKVEDFPDLPPPLPTTSEGSSS